MSYRVKIKSYKDGKIVELVIAEQDYWLIQMLVDKEFICLMEVHNS